MLEWIVAAEHSGTKLILFLTIQLKNQYSARFLKRSIEENRCQMNGRIERFASAAVGKGDRISLDLDVPERFNRLSIQFDPSLILYEDSEFFAYNKPSGVASDAQGMLHLLKSYSSSLRLLHRLDRETTGILLLVKTDDIFERMVRQFKLFAIQKRYLAIVDGCIDKKKGTIENFLGKKHSYQGQAIWGEVKPENGLYAKTDWLALKTTPDASLLHCYPKTGRTHQIRVHLAESGYPILGDFHYCKHFFCSYRPERYLLHHDKMTFIHPKTGQPICLNASLPKDFLKAQERLFKPK